MTRLDAFQLGGVEDLEAACIANDGGRLKLEYGALRGRSGERPDDYLWLAPGGEVVGFCGIYQFGGAVPEVTGMVHPAWRRQGVFTALLGAALAELAGRGVERALLVVHRGWAPGAALAEKMGGRLEHSEHRMRQLEAPEPLPPDDPIVLRPAVVGDPDDAAFVRTCLTEAFGGTFGLPDNLEEGTTVIEDAGRPVGVMRVDRNSPTLGSIYGFGVRSALQGQGIGRRALVRATTDLRATGVGEVRLEVAVENDNALRLYERCGFERQGTEDYYEVPVGAAP